MQQIQEAPNLYLFISMKLRFPVRESFQVFVSPARSLNYMTLIVPWTSKHILTTALAVKFYKICRTMDEGSDKQKFGEDYQLLCLLCSDDGQVRLFIEKYLHSLAFNLFAKSQTIQKLVPAGRPIYNAYPS